MTEREEDIPIQPEVDVPIQAEEKVHLKKKSPEEILREHLGVKEPLTNSELRSLDRDHTMEIKIAHENEPKRIKVKNGNNEVNPQINQPGHFKRDMRQHY